HAFSFFFFFFQAEDGIRDFHVTGVQTCALPISGLKAGARIRRIGTEEVSSADEVVRKLAKLGEGAKLKLTVVDDGADRELTIERSEERRVGKECRSRGLSDDEKKKVSVIDVSI